MPEFKPDLSAEDQRRVVEGVLRFMEGVPGVENGAIARGRHEAQASLITRQFGRRLGRTLTDAERQIVLDRLSTVGADRLGDVVLDLTPEQLGAWIADPDAR